MEANIIITNYTGKILQLNIDAESSLAFRIYPDKTIKKLINVTTGFDAIGINAVSENDNVYKINSTYNLSYYRGDIELIFLLGGRTDISFTPIGKLVVKNGKIFRANQYKSNPGTRYLSVPITDDQHALIQGGQGMDTETDWGTVIFILVLIILSVIMFTAVAYITYLMSKLMK